MCYARLVNLLSAFQIFNKDGYRSTMSSYELFVQDPISPAENSSFHPFSLTKCPNFDIGVARSGVKGPLIVGSISERFYNPC